MKINLVLKEEHLLSSKNINKKITLLLFAYCNNNHMMGIDPRVYFVITLSMIITGVLIGAGVLVSRAITGLSAVMGREEDESFWGAFSGGFIDGAVGSLAVALTAAIPGVGGILAGAGLAFVNGFTGSALRLSGTVIGATKLARFIDASKISVLGVAITGYLIYYSFPSVNKIRNTKESR